MVDDIYEYKTINVSLEPRQEDGRKPTIQSAANGWAALGWRTVAVMPSAGVGYADAILIERRAGHKAREDDGE